MVGRYARIISMEGEPQYEGRIGKVIFVDDIGQIHGTWGGCAIIPETDRYELLPEERNDVFELSEKTKTSVEGINMLIEYYRKSLGWSEKESCEYAKTLFENGTIDQIKVIGGKDGGNKD